MRHAKGKLVDWQLQLIDQVISALISYYCLTDSSTVDKIQRLEVKMIDCLNKYNASLHEDLLEKPISEDGYRAYLALINRELEAFDSHCHLEYANAFLSTLEPDNVVKGSRSARFDLGPPPLHILQQMNEFRGTSEQNYGFSNSPPMGRSVPNDVGYLKINYSLDPRLGEEEKDSKYRLGPNAVSAATSALSELKNKRKIVIDLRNVEEGGSPEMIQYIVSFFIGKTAVVINTVIDRLTDTRKIFASIETPFKLLDMPVDILVDKTTFSALEELAYDFQQMATINNRFCVVGETTKGGAHPTFSFPLMNQSDKSINSDLILWVPCQRSVNPISGTNWEGVGVIPDVEVQPGQDALETSLSRYKKDQQYSGSMTKLLMRNNTLFCKLEDQYLENHRHDHPRIQREYDKRFGLVPKL